MDLYLSLIFIIAITSSFFTTNLYGTLAPYTCMFLSEFRNVVILYIKYITYRCVFLKLNKTFSFVLCSNYVPVYIIIICSNYVPVYIIIISIIIICSNYACSCLYNAVVLSCI